MVRAALAILLLAVASQASASPALLRPSTYLDAWFSRFAATCSSVRPNDPNVLSSVQNQVNELERNLRSDVNAIMGQIHPDKAKELHNAVDNLIRNYRIQLLRAKTPTDVYRLYMALKPQTEALGNEIKNFKDALEVAARNTQIFESLLESGINSLNGKIPDNELNAMRSTLALIKINFAQKVKQARTPNEIDAARANSMPPIYLLQAQIRQKTEEAGAAQSFSQLVSINQEILMNNLNSLNGKIHPSKIQELNYAIGNLANINPNGIVAKEQLKSDFQNLLDQMNQIKSSLTLGSSNAQLFESLLRQGIADLEKTNAVSSQEINEMKEELNQMIQKFNRDVMQAKSSAEIDNIRASVMPSIFQLQHRIKNSAQLTQFRLKATESTEKAKQEMFKNIDQMKGKINPDKVAQLTDAANQILEQFSSEVNRAQDIDEIQALAENYTEKLLNVESEIKDIMAAIAVADRNTLILKTQLTTGIDALKGKIPDEEVEEMYSEVQDIVDSFGNLMLQSTTAQEIDEARAISMKPVLALRAKIQGKSEHVGAIALGKVQAKAMNENLKSALKPLEGRINAEKLQEMQSTIDNVTGNYAEKLVNNPNYEEVLEQSKSQYDDLTTEIQDLVSSLAVADATSDLFRSQLRAGLKNVEGKVSDAEYEEMSNELARIANSFAEKMAAAKSSQEIFEARASSMPAIYALQAKLTQSAANK